LSFTKPSIIDLVTDFVLLREPNGIYLFDRRSGTAKNISTGPSGAEGNGTAYSHSASDDALFIVYSSSDVTIDPQDSNNALDIFLYDRTTQTNRVISLGLSGQSAND